MPSPTSAVIRLRVTTTAERAEIVGAEAFAAGAAGIEEREEGSCIVLLVYAPAACAEAVERAARGAAGAGATLAIETLREQDWPETWKEGLRPIAVSPRLVVRPSFTAAVLAPGQVEVAIEPRQAFGTGAHGSTALALALVDARLAMHPGGRVLDVGCGSGVLALAALALGAGAAVACDLDPIAARETRENAARNGLAGLVAFTGTLDALAPARFDVVVANMIRRELEPLLAELVARVAPGGVLVVSGLLAGERGAIEAALRALGARSGPPRVREDDGGDAWLALTATR